MTGVVFIPVFVPYEPAHRAACLDLFDQNCPDYFAPNEREPYAAFLDAGPADYCVAVHDGVVRAAFGVTDTEQSGHRRINWILVARAAQGGGIGAAMMAEARRRAQKDGVRVLDIAASHRSAPFFAKYGSRVVAETADGWGPGMHRVDMELRLSPTLFQGAGGAVVLPTLVLVDRRDGGHLVIDPPREVWERSELTREELLQWSLLVAATGRAMIDVLPQLSGGCINYWDAGNWALHDAAEPNGRKDPRRHRRVHLHLFGRNPNATHPSWQWGEAPRFPPFAERQQWASSFEPLTAAECDAIVARATMLLTTRYGC
jgi:GNAT superfamily N-acetyltransferase